MDGEAIVNRVDNVLFLKFGADERWQSTDGTTPADTTLSMGLLFMTNFRLYFAGYPDPSKVSEFGAFQLPLHHFTRD